MMSSVLPKINGGVITSKLQESRTFYTDVLQFTVKFESDWYLLLSCPNNPSSEIAFLAPNHPTQSSLFQKPYGGSGTWFTYEVANVEEEYERIKKLGVEIAFDLKTEEWGDRHFAIIDPNGVAIDILSHNPA